MTCNIFSTFLRREEKRKGVSLMVQLPPKKGPRMTAGIQGTNKTHDFGRDEHEVEMNRFIRKVGTVIEEARCKMSDQERKEADRKADTILKNASDAASARRRSA